jgi:hypothetical protein
MWECELYQGTQVCSHLNTVPKADRVINRISYKDTRKLTTLHAELVFFVVGVHGLVKGGTFRICCQKIRKQRDMLFYYCTIIVCTDPPNTTTLIWAFHKSFDKEGSLLECDAELIDD